MAIDKTELGKQRWISGMVLALLAVGAILLAWQFGCGGTVPAPELGSETPAPSAIDGQSELGSSAHPVAEDQPVRDPVIPVQDSRSRTESNELWGLVIRGETGAPVSGATISLCFREADEFWNLDLEYGQEERVLAQTTSDADGRFAFAVDQGHPHRLRVQAYGYAERTITECLGGSEVRIELDRGATVSGTVLEEGSGRPIVDAEIVVAVRGESIYLARTKTLQDGSYRAEGLAKADVYVQARPRDYAQVWKRVELVPGQYHQVDFEIAPGRTLVGRVTDAGSGLGIPHAVLSDSWTFKRTVRTDGEGMYTLKGVDSEGEIHVRARHYAGQARHFGLTSEGRVDFALSQGGSIRGRMLDAEGKPFSSAYIAVASSYMTRPGMQHTDWLRADMESTGQFFAKGLNPQYPYSILLRAKGFGTRVYALPKPVPDGETLDLGDFVMHEEGAIIGRVANSSGDPLSDCEVRLEGKNRDQGRLLGEDSGRSRSRNSVTQFEDRSTRTTSAGRFYFTGVSGGKYAIHVRASGRNWRESFGPYEVTDGEFLQNLELSIDFGLSITGKISRSDGLEMNGADFRVVLQCTGEDSRDLITVNADGTFLIDNLEEGDYVISGMRIPKGWTIAPKTGVTAGEKNLSLILEPSATISGIVVDADGKPVAGAYVSFSNSQVSQASRRTDAQGRFELDAPQGSQGKVSAVLYNDGLAIKIPRGSASQEEVPAGSKDLVLTLR